MRNLEEKIVTIDNISKLSDKLRASGNKIVTTNGCFDILHLGHITYLIEAKNLGDILIVGINSDRSVEKLKGPNRPLQPELIRAKQIAGLESVDYVTIFPDDTPINLLGLIKPNVHVKGGDYLPEKLPEKQIVESCGGKVICVSMMTGFSTTDLIEKIRTKI